MIEEGMKQKIEQLKQAGYKPRNMEIVIPLLYVGDISYLNNGVWIENYQKRFNDIGIKDSSEIAGLLGLEEDFYSFLINLEKSGARKNRIRKYIFAEKISRGIYYDTLTMQILFLDKADKLSKAFSSVKQHDMPVNIPAFSEAEWMELVESNAKSERALEYYDTSKYYSRDIRLLHVPQLEYINIDYQEYYKEDAPEQIYYFPENKLQEISLHYINPPEKPVEKEVQMPDFSDIEGDWINKISAIHKRSEKYIAHREDCVLSTWEQQSELYYALSNAKKFLWISCPWLGMGTKKEKVIAYRKFTIDDEYDLYHYHGNNCEIESVNADGSYNVLESYLKSIVVDDEDNTFLQYEYKNQSGTITLGELIRELLERSDFKKLYIQFGYEPDELEIRSLKAVRVLYDSIPEKYWKKIEIFHQFGNHQKMIIMDEERMVVGSYNFLSFSGNTENYQRDERGYCTDNTKIIKDTWKQVKKEHKNVKSMKDKPDANIIENEMVKMSNGDEAEALRDMIEDMIEKIKNRLN